jgi:SAM-dependent methyltransferase
MKSFEMMYLCMKPFSPPLYQIIRGRLHRIAKGFAYRPKILDAGGRRSHYTIGVPADIIITDLLRETAIQKKLNLGLTRGIIKLIKCRRSNIKAILFDDMTHSALRTESFDCLVAVEVLEHVEEDFLFVKEVARVLKPGGTFLMTTPNGDFVPKTNPDHKRHYSRQQLHSLLQSVFAEVKVDYAVVGGIYRKLGLKSYSFKHPLRTALMMVSNLVNSIQSAYKAVHDQAHGTYHLIATARK